MSVSFVRAVLNQRLAHFQQSQPIERQNDRLLQKNTTAERSFALSLSEKRDLRCARSIVAKNGLRMNIMPSAKKRIAELQRFLPTESLSPTASDEAAAPFGDKVRSILIPDAQGNIHEEELQHAIVVYLLDDINPRASDYYIRALDRLIGQGDPPMSVEDSVKGALQQTVDQRLISTKDAERINGISFRAAQLDQNLKALYDGSGSATDPTIALMPIDQAIVKAEAALEALKTGTIPLELRSLSAPSNTVFGLGIPPHTTSTSRNVF